MNAYDFDLFGGEQPAADPEPELRGYQAEALQALRESLKHGPAKRAAVQAMVQDPGSPKAQREARALLEGTGMGLETAWKLSRNRLEDTVWDASCRCSSAVLSAPTGSGKGLMAAWLARDLIAEGARVAYLTPRVPLIDQEVREFGRLDIRHALLHADRSTRDYDRHSAVIASIGTVQARGGLREAAGRYDVVIWDEMHILAPNVLSEVIGTADHLIGMSATPMGERLWQWWQAVVPTTTTNVLTEQGFLSPLEVHRSRVAINTAGVETDFHGEYNEESLAIRVSAELEGIASEYIELCEELTGEPGLCLPTVAFMPSQRLCRQFADFMAQATGEPWRAVITNEGSNANDDSIKDFKFGQVTGVVTCDKLSVGFDAPDVQVMIDAYPVSRSIKRQEQKKGRGRRIAAGKDICHLLDSARNQDVHGAILDMIDEHGVTDLEWPGEPGLATGGGQQEGGNRKRCLACDYEMPIGMMVCPECDALYGRGKQVASGAFGGIFDAMLHEQPLDEITETEGSDGQIAGWYAFVHISCYTLATSYKAKTISLFMREFRARFRTWAEGCRARTGMGTAIPSGPLSDWVRELDAYLRRPGLYEKVREAGKGVRVHPDARAFVDESRRAYAASRKAGQR